ncbi:oligosaccharide flippase family protein [Microseira sp. BLCC-F43]|uniref:oligosaccharide flippase family protein n=1 Tax=Microseira sp. BLCC-F43 TaxID=3153602 RepID=UPI0035B7364D
MSSIKALAIRGAVWTFAAYGMSMMLRLGSNLILTRLLLPEAYGLINLVYVFITGLHLFSDVGIGPSIIQNKRGDDPAFLNTAWTIQVVRGVCLWVGSLLLAEPAAQFYNEPRLLLLLPVVGLNAIISGFNSTALFTLNREVAIGKLAIYELAGQITSMAVTIVCAYYNPTVWAMVTGGFASALVQMVWSHRLFPEQPNRFAWERDAVKSIFSFGKWIFVSTALYFFVSQSDRMILGKLISLEMLGIYGIAFTLADIPRQVILALSNKVIFPSFAKLADLPRETFRAKIIKSRRLMLVALAAGLSLLIGFGDRLVFILYKSNYHEAGWMVPIIALGIWHTSLYFTTFPALLALGNARYNPPGSLLAFMTIAIGLPVAFSQFKLVGAMFVIAFYDLPLYAVNMYGLWREGLICLGQDIVATVLFLLLLSSVVLVRYILGWGLPINQILIQ